MTPRTRIPGSAFHRYPMVLAIVAFGISAMPLHAQSEERDPSIADLPRQGYEPRTVRLGATVIQPSLALDMSYDDNIFADRSIRAGDTVVNVQPRILAGRSTANLDLRADAHAALTRYALNPRENVDSFGVNIRGTIRGEKRALVVAAAFDRTFERRSDPEASTDRSRSPALINLATGDLQYRYEGTRIGIKAKLAVVKLDYLPAVDADRDFVTYRASVRGLFSIGRRMAVFVEPFANRRDAKLAVDRSGFDRDTTTAGALAGVAFDLTGKLDGDIGIGVFRSNPDDRSLRAFTGLAANGRIVWRPQTRTAITVAFFRGDVMTNRLGALGRVDTRLSLTIDQEARHNLTLHARIASRKVHYRGSDNSDQRYLSCEGEARYLLNRSLALVFNATYSRRNADDPSERYYRWQTTGGVRLTY
ncbi:MAG: hypothetical protein EOP61_27670 [Sphingomonadales bacterium]|nr:MAG: hypothetical protein EOP61_27670 [Sphingomonadales bacterium]